MPSTRDFIPPVNEALELPVDELAMRLLRYLASCEAAGEQAPLNSHSILLVGLWPGHDLSSNPRNVHSFVRLPRRGTGSRLEACLPPTPTQAEDGSSLLDAVTRCLRGVGSSGSCGSANRR